MVSILATDPAAAASWGGMLLWLVVMFGFLYFFMIRPQKKEAQKKSAMLAELVVGDTVLTTSGFYGIFPRMMSLWSSGAIKTAVSRCRKRQSRRWRSRIKRQNNQSYAKRSLLCDGIHDRLFDGCAAGNARRQGC